MRGTALVTAASFLVALALIWIAGVTGARHLAVNLVASYFMLWGLAFTLSPRPRELQARFVLLSATLAFTAGTLELTALTGVVDWRGIFGAQDGPPWLNAGNAFDPQLLHVRRPHLKLSGVQVGGNIARSQCLPPAGRYPYALSYDRNGFRNAVELSRADIAVVGDSYIEAIETPVDRTVTSLLASLTGSTVANLGLSGYGPQQELAVLERYALPLEPRVVVWAFYEGNDLHDLLHYEETIAELPQLETRPGLRDRSFVQNALKALDGMLETCKPGDFAHERYGVFHAHDGRELKMYFVDGGHALGPIELAALQRFGGILARAHERTRERNVRLVLLLVPTTFRVYREVVEFPSFSTCAGWVTNDLPQRLEQLARLVSPDIAFLDLTPEFAAGTRRGEQLYLPDDTHWAPAGHAAAAQALAARLAHEN